MGPSALSPALRSQCTVTPRSAVSGPSSHHSVWAVGGGHAGIPGSHRPRGCLAGLPPPPHSGPRPRPASAWPPQRLSPIMASAQDPLLHLSSSSPTNALLAPPGQLLLETSSVPAPSSGPPPWGHRETTEASTGGLGCGALELLRPGPSDGHRDTRSHTLPRWEKQGGAAGNTPSQGPLRAALPRGPSPATREGGPRGGLPFLHPGRLQPPSPPPGPAPQDQQQTRNRLLPRARQPGPRPSLAHPPPCSPRSSLGSCTSHKHRGDATHPPLAHPSPAGPAQPSTGPLPCWAPPGHRPVPGLTCAGSPEVAGPPRPLGHTAQEAGASSGR